MSDNIRTTTGQTLSCLQQKTGKTKYFVEVYFSDTDTQSVDDKRKCVILHALKHEKWAKTEEK